MTDNEKYVFTVLLNGGSIANCHSSGFRVRDNNKNPVHKVHTAFLIKYMKLMRKDKTVYVINKNKVRQLHGKSWIKKLYKSIVNHAQVSDHLK